MFQMKDNLSNVMFVSISTYKQCQGCHYAGRT